MVEDFISQLTSLHIDSNTDKKSWSQKLGTYGFTLACILFLNFQSSSEDKAYLSWRSSPSPYSFANSVRNFISWIEKNLLLYLVIQRKLQQSYLSMASMKLLRAYFLLLMHMHVKKRHLTVFRVLMVTGVYICLHLLGFYLLAEAQCGLKGISKEKKFMKLFAVSLGEV